MKSFIFFVMLTASFSLIAGDKVGNGGDVIVCPDQKTVILDLYQGKVDWDFEMVERTGSRAEIIHETMKEFSDVDPFIADKILRRAMEINNELGIKGSKLVKLTKNALVNISDEGVAELPVGCKIVQAATQIQTPFPGEVKFTFQKDLWDSLEADVQASLILHEVIYEHMISVGETASRSTRYLNAALHSGHINSVKNYLDISSFFSFKNLEIDTDGKLRQFGKKNSCSIRRSRFKPGNSDLREGTTIIVNSKNVQTKAEDFQNALHIFWKKFASMGECD